MKRFGLFCLFALLTLRVHAAANVSFLFANATNYPGVQMPLRLIPTNVPVVYNGTLIQRDRLDFVCDTNGAITVSNLAPVPFICQVGGGTSSVAVTTFMISVPDTNATVSFASILSGPTNAQSSATTFYTIAAQEGIFAHKTNAVFIGPITGDGGGLTNVPGAMLDVTRPPFNAVGDGTTDDTAAFQSALATRIPVFVPPWKTNGYVISNLILSNNTLYSYGAKLKMKTGSTGFMIQYAPTAIGPSYAGISNDWSNAKLIGLELDGGGGTTIPSSLGTRHGVWVDPFGTNNVMKDCYVHGFSGHGVYITSSKPSAGVAPYIATDQSEAFISSCTAHYNYEGFYFFSGTPFNTDNYVCEYMVAGNLKASFNGVGIKIECGNISIANGDFSRNSIGVILAPTQNDGHGVMTGCLLNHNTSAILATNISNGFTFSSCDLFQGSSYWTNCYGICFENGQAGGCSFTFDSGGLNYVRNTRCLSTFAPPTFTHQNGDHSITYGNDDIRGSGTVDRINYALSSQTADTLSVTNLTVTTMTGPPATFSGLTLFGKGWPANVETANVGTNLNNQFNNTTLVTVPSAADGTYMILCSEQSTASGTAGTMNTTFNYTDQFGTARTVGTLALTLGAVGAPTNAIYYLHAKKNTTIGITTVISGGGGGSVYALDVEFFQLR